MPTIPQLPLSVSVDPADEVPISQNGTTNAISVGTLLSTMQPAISVPTGVLLGRNSVGAGGPEPVSIGLGLSVEAGNLTATGGDHATFPVSTTPSGLDQLVIASSGQPKLVALSTLQSWLGIGGGGGFNIAGYPTANVLSSTDLIPVSQNGTVAAVSYSNLLAGETIDQAPPAAAAADTDAVWVSQGTSTLLRQTFAAIWNWIAQKLTTYKLPIVELSVNTTLDGTVHNGRLLVCSQPVTLTPAFLNMGSGFVCEVLNLSTGTVTFGPGVTTSTGQMALAASQAALVRGVTYSGGNVVFVSFLSGSGTASAPTSPPGQVSNLVSTAVASTSITVAWSPPAIGAPFLGYTVQYRVTGTTSWLTASALDLTTSFTVTGLSPSTEYDVIVTAVNAAGNGNPSSVPSIVTTSSSGGVPGQVVDLVSNGASSTTVSLSWAAPSSGGTPTGYTVQYALSIGSSWTTASTSVSGLSFVVVGLNPSTGYQFVVSASNAAGTGVPSAVLVVTTPAGPGAVSAITWNLAPNNTYSAGAGSIGVNVHVSPSTSPVQFGLSLSPTTLPTVWTLGTYVNTDLWGAYLATPATRGTYYVWCEGTDSSSPTVCASAFGVS